MKKLLVVGVIILLMMTPIITYAMPINFEKSDSYHMHISRMLITESLIGRVIEIDKSGSIVWQKTDLDTPMDSERLENGNTLITESGKDRVIEVNQDGSIVWEKNGLNKPIDAERLSNGNTLITEEIGEKVSEVDVDGNEVWNITNLHVPKDAERLGNGNTLIVEYGSHRIIEVDRSGTIKNIIPDLSGPFDVEIDDNGLIITEYLGGRVFFLGCEITGLNGPIDAEKLGNSNILISEYIEGRIIEVNRSCTVVWEKTNLSGPIDVEILNQPPDAPIIKGPSKVKVTLKSTQGPGPYNYSFNATDPDGDNVSYFIDWGDGTSTGWIGPYESGIAIIVSHTWSAQGTYTVRAKAKDIHGAEGPWGTLEVWIPRNNLISNILVIQVMNRFPRLNQLTMLIMERWST